MMTFYDRYVLPRLIHCICGGSLLARHRAALIPVARGDVLEIGIGSALNLEYYDSTRVSSLTGIDPSDELLAYARNRVKKAVFPVNLVPAIAECLPLPDATMDTVAVTFSLCTIPGISTALGEIRRVLKPNGRLLFLEHGLAPDPNVRRWQQRLDPVWGKLAGGCHLTRDIPGLLAAAAFTDIDIQSNYLRFAPRFAGYLYRGSAAA